MLNMNGVRVALFFEWPRLRQPIEQELHHTARVLEQIADLLPSEPLPARAALEEHLSEAEPLQANELHFAGTGAATQARLTVVTGAASPIWCPHRLVLALRPSAAASKSRDARQLLIELGRGLSCTFGALVSNYGASIYPASSLDMAGRPIVGWLTLLDRQQYEVPSQHAAELDERYSLIELAAPWDFDNQSSRKRYENLSAVLCDWASVTSPRSLQEQVEALIQNEGTSV